MSKNMAEEIWNDIPGYKGLYQVSNLGQVKSLNYNRKGKEQILKYFNRRGYYQVILSKNGVRKNFGVHRLVYMTFKGEIPEGMHVNHINENKLDNRPENLNLLTPKENNNWGTHNERVAKAMVGKHINRKDLSKSVLQYDLNGNFIAEWPSMREIQRQYGLGGNISACCSGKAKSAGGYVWKFK